MSLNASAFAANACSSRSSAGSSVFVASSSAARWTAEGKTSLDDCPMFTWSFGCAPEASRAPRWRSCSTTCPSPSGRRRWGTARRASPAAIASAARAIFSASEASSSPSSAFARAAAPLTRPSQRTTGSGTRSPETGKFATALVVSPPHSCSVSCTLTLILRSLESGANASGGASAGSGVTSCGSSSSRQCEHTITGSATPPQVWRSTTGGPVSQRCSSPQRMIATTAG